MSVACQPGTAHSVQFFDSDETRQQAVAGFLAQGYSSGFPLILIARPFNSKGILDRLEEAGSAVHQDPPSRRITVLDAIETLRRISRSGSPDARLFEDVIGAVVTRVSRQGRAYVYTELVDILAQRGDFTDAVLLEEFWNRLAVRTPVSLMCGYAVAHFVSRGTQDALRDVCAAHSSVLVEPQDPLAVWLLAQAQ